VETALPQDVMNIEVNSGQMQIILPARYWKGVKKGQGRRHVYFILIVASLYENAIRKDI
jgi:hypothetical protein